MAKAKRVFQLAKELGVDSKAVLAKCQAEGLDINNHMSTVSIGLEMTIREWFSEETSSTAVETAEKVDVERVRKRAKAKARKRAKPIGESADTDIDSGGDTATATVEPETEPVEATAAGDAEEPEQPAEPESPGEPGKAQKRSITPSEPEEEPAAEAEQAEPAESETEAAPQVAAEADSAEAETEEDDEEDTTAKPNVPDRPDVVSPAGPKLSTPKPAKLKGPKVVRVEEPEPERKRRPRSERPTGMPDLMQSKGPTRGRGVGGRDADMDDGGRSPRRRKGRGRNRGGDYFRGKVSEKDLREREERLNRAGGFLRQRRRDMRKRSEGGQVAETPIKVGGKVEIAEPISIKDLSAATGIRGAEIIKHLFNQGIMATINQAIDSETAQEIALEYDIELVVKEAQTAEQAVVSEFEERERSNVQPRPPVVTILGHVDHGKTSLLDKIREADVAEGESGGITQHIGAYRATIPGSDGEPHTVVFLDTPGHEAFTSMRARGAKLTDVVVLVVAADDGVMPQTVESINHAKAADVPIVVALNKIDTPQATDAQVQKVLGQLAENELNPAEWGGDTEVVRTSAETGEGIEDLVEILDLQAEILELTAGFDGPAQGRVIEAELTQGRGAVARMLVQEGSLSVGDFIVCGRGFGRVRDMVDDRGNHIEDAGPSTPVEISGLDEVPDAGDRFFVTSSLDQAERIATQRRDQERQIELKKKSAVTLDTVFERMKEADVKELRIVVKADVQGSVEVLKKTLEEVGEKDEQVAVRVLHAAVGGITESDVLLAEASDAVIVGFHVIATPHARTEAENRGVDMRLYQVIYNVVDDVTAALEGMLDPTQREEVLGHAEVREVFRVSKVGMVAGCYVTDGRVERNALIRVTRDGIVIENDRKLSSLKRFKDDVRDVRAGMECGMSIDGYDDVKAGDVLECYVQTEVKQKLG